MPSLVLPVDHGRVLALCPSVSDYERRARRLGTSVFGWLVDGCRFCIRWPKVGSIRLDSRVAKLESKINYKAKPALCALIRDAQRGECCGRYEIDAIRYLPADAGAVWRYEVTWVGDSKCTPELQVFDAAYECHRCHRACV